jgi:hypothetical protein
MQLTIIPSDGAVYKDGLCYSELTWDGTPSNVHALQFNFDSNAGWIEYNDGTPNESITAIPTWAQNAEAAWQVAYNEEHKPPVPVPPTAEENKATAMYLLQQTDWTELPSVVDPAQSNPYLANQSDFIAYRNAVRQYAINPIEGDIEWLEIPQEVWQTV